MSTIKADNISNVAGTASTSMLNAINGSAKAWVNFNGTGTVAIRASYNVSSVTDGGVGICTVNFTIAMADANYIPYGLSRDLDDVSGMVWVGYNLSHTKTVTAFQFGVQYQGTYYDSVDIGISILR